MVDDVDAALPSGIAAIRARLLALDDAHAKGDLDDTTYANARRDAERALTDAVLATPIGAAAPKRVARPSTRLLVALSVAVLVVAAGGYVATGSPSLAGRTAPVAAAAPATAADGDQIGPQQIAAMVDKLAARLKDKPDDAEGWTMLARSYVVLARYRDALPAYQQALRLQPRNADLVADYADAVAAASDGPSNAESIALVARALAIDPVQPKALALSGTVAFDRGDYALAVAQWQKIVDTLPPGGEFRKQVMTNIDEARTRGGLPAPAGTAPSVASSTVPSTAPSAPSPAPSKAPPVANATPGHEALTGIVSLDPALAAAVAPTDTVFVLARPESGRMPLAVFRATVKDLPLRFRLDDSMAMTPTMKLSDMKQVIVAARVSKSGNAISQPGDLSGESGLVAPGTKDLAIVIGGVARPR